MYTELRQRASVEFETRRTIGCCVYHCSVLDWVGRLLLLNTAPIFMYSSFIALTGTLGRIVYTSKALSNMVHALSFANSFSSR